MYKKLEQKKIKNILTKPFKYLQRVFYSALFVMVCLFIIVPNVSSAVGIRETINFQGKLVNSSGLNVADNNYSVVFSLYSVSSGGSNIWTETQTVATTDGLFRVELGSVSSLSGVNFNDDSLYLGIKVGADAEMTPRVRFTATPYAMQAKNMVWSGLQSPVANTSLNMAAYTTSLLYSGTSGSSDLFVLSSSANSTGTGRLMSLRTATDSELSPFHVSAKGVEALFVSNLGRVGIGTTNPGVALQVVGNITASGIISGTGSGLTGLNASNISSGTIPTASVVGTYGNITGLGTLTSLNVSGAITSGTITSSGIISGTTFRSVLGSISTPSYSFTADTDTGIFSPGANILGFVTSGTERMRINASGNVGIGTTNPVVKLDVAGTTSIGSSPSDYLAVRSGGILYLQNSLSNSSLAFQNLGSTGQNALQIRVGSANDFNILNNGNVGIGTTSPNTKLDVQGNLFVGTGTFSNAEGWSSVIDQLGSSHARYSIRNGTTEGRIMVHAAGWWGSPTNAMVIGTAGAHALSLGTNSGVDLTIDSAGRVGIGTTNPGNKLEVAGNITITNAADANGNLRFSAANPYIYASSYFVAPGGAYFNSGTVYTEAQIQARGGIADDGGVLELNDDVNIGNGDLYVVNSSGNVGIGTASPIGKLHVNVGDILLSHGSNYNSAGARYGGNISLLTNLKGRQVNDNPDFMEATAGYIVYDNGGSGSISLSIVADTTAPSSSGRVMRITHTNSGSPSPYWGGFYKATTLCAGSAVGHCMRQGNRHVVRIWAKIPAGMSISFHSNSMGTGGNFQWISSTAGTGNWEEYIAVETMGAGASSTNFFALSGGSRPFTWDVASMEIIDVDAPADVDRASSLNVGYKNGITLGNGNLLTTAATYLATDGGNVGIGTTSPGQKLAVMGGNMFIDGSSGYDIYNWSASNADWRIGMNNNNSKVGFARNIATAHVQYATFADGSGQGFAVGDNVSGLSSFEVTGSGSSYLAFFRGSVTLDGQGGQLRFRKTELTDSYDDLGIWNSNTNNTFYIADWASGTKGLTVNTSSGNVNVVSGALQQGGNQVLHAGNYTSYALPLSGGTVTGLTTFTPDESLNLKGIRGQFSSGSDGQGIHLFSNVTIGDPSGWGNGLGFTPSRGLSTWGGIRPAYGVGMTAWNVTTPGQGVGAVHLGAASSTADAGMAITWGARDASSGGNGQAGIYVVSGGNFGTRMYLATTDSYATGARTAISISEGGVVNITRNALQQGGNQVLHAGNYTSYSPSLTGSGASGTWGINITGNADNASKLGGVSSSRAILKRRTRILTADSTSLNSSITAPEMGFTYGGSGEPAGPFVAFGGLSGDIDYSMQLVGAYNGGNTFVIRTRNDDAASWNAWRTIITDGNYSSYSPPYGGGTLTGRWYFQSNLGATSGAINNPPLQVFATGGNSAFMSFHRSGSYAVNFGLDSDNVLRIGGWSAAANRWVLDMSGNNTIPGRLTANAWTTSGRNYSNEWIEFPNHSGLYSPKNDAHFYPNNASYGSWRVEGSRNGWHGLHFGSDVTLMVNSNEVGFHREGHGWQMRWSAGTGYVNKGNPGGGTQATILDSVNYSSYSPPYGGGTLTGRWFFQSNLGATSGTINDPPLQVFATGGNSAFMSFHRSGSYAVNFGLDSDNVLRIGGWSAAANRWVLDMSGNNTIPGRLTANAWTTSGRNYSNEWIEFPNHRGLYSPLNNAHFYPNTESYGSWLVAGSRNGWHGLHFGSDVTLMVNSNEVGFHREGHGWQMRWSAGTGYVNKGNPGGGTQATILDSVNYTSYTLPLSGGTISGSLGIGPVPSNRLVVGADIGASSVPNNTISLGNASGNSVVQVGQDASNKGFLQWVYNATPSSAYYVVATGNGQPVIVQSNSSSTNSFVGIGTVSPSQKLEVNGRIRMNTWTADGDAVAYRDNATNSIALITSDRRLKKDIIPLSSAIDVINQVGAYKYHELDEAINDKYRLGVMAQELMPLMPELTYSFTKSDSSETYYSVHYDKLTVLLLKGIQEQQLQIESQNTALQALGPKVIDLEATLAQIELERATSVSQEEGGSAFENLYSMVENTVQRVAIIENNVSEILARLDSLVAPQISASDSARIEDLSQRMSFVEAMFMGEVSNMLNASASSQLAQSVNENEIIFDKKLILQNEITVLGSSNFSDVGVTGKIINNTLVINGMDENLATAGASINTLAGALNLQSNGTNDINFVGDNFKMDKNGDFSINKGDIKLAIGSVKGSDGMRGVDVVVSALSTELRINFTEENDTANYAVGITPSWFTNFLVTNKSKTGFTIKFSSQAPTGAKLDWIIIE